MISLNEKYKVFLESNFLELEKNDSSEINLCCKKCNRDFVLSYRSFIYNADKNISLCLCENNITEFDFLPENIKNIFIRLKLGKIQFRGAHNELTKLNEKLFIFTNHLSKDTSISECIYTILNHIIEIPKCKHCKENCAFRSSREGYSSLCKNKECHRKSLNNGYKEKYGENYNRFEHAMKKAHNVSKWQDVEHFKEAKKHKHIESWNKEHEKLLNDNLIDRINSSQYKCNVCRNIQNITSTFHIRIKAGINPCETCLPHKKGISDKQLEIQNFIIDSGYEISSCYREFKKYEIDIFIPSLNIGFEYNGLYWHSDIYRDNNYHKEKTEFFRQQGIQIYHIWEDDWRKNPQIIKSRILSLLNVNCKKVYARKTEIKLVSNELSKQFLIENHLQGNVNAPIRIGLFYENELISLMTFGKKRGIFKNTGIKSYELYRFCNKLNYIVIGGASKIFNKFVSEYLNNSDEIITFSDNSWGVGNVYKMIGFEFIKNTVPGYYYIENGNRVFRFKYRKSELVKLGYDKNKTENEITKEMGLLRVYDCGCSSWCYMKK